MVDIRGLDKVEVLIALWKEAKPAKCDAKNYAPLTKEQAGDVVAEKKYYDEYDGHDHIFIDYLNGKGIHIEIGRNDFDEWNYDRANGTGAAQKAIDKLRENGGTNDA